MTFLHRRLQPTDSVIGKFGDPVSSGSGVRTREGLIGPTQRGRLISVKVIEIALLLTIATTSEGAILVFDNGLSSGGQGAFANIVGKQYLYEDFSLSANTTITGVTWQQHEASNIVYDLTEMSIYQGLPQVSSVLFTVNAAASRTPNTTGILYGTQYGFDYSLVGLNIALPAGTYWLGLNNVYHVPGGGGSAGTTWDSTIGGPNTIPGARLINSNFTAPGTTVGIPNFAFQIMAVPEPSKYLLMSLGLFALGLVARRGSKAA